MTIIDPAMANAAPVGVSRNARENEQRKRWNVLNGGLRELARAEIVKRHDSKYLADTGLIAHLDSSVDTYSRIVRLLADAYRIAPARRWTHPMDTELWKLVIDPSWDIAMDELLQISFAACVAFARPYVNQDGAMSLEILPPHTVINADWRSPTKLNSISYWLDNETSIEWTKAAWRTLNIDGSPKSGWVRHSYGRVPISVMRTTWPSSTDMWTWRRRSDLLEAAVLICVWNSYISRIAAYQSHLQLVEKPFSRGEGEIAPSLGIVDEVRSGPDTVLRGNYETLDLQADVDKFINNVETRIRRVAADYGLAHEMISGGSYRSAEERIVAHAALAEYRAGLLKIVTPADKDLMRCATIVWNADGDGSLFSGSEPLIDYAEPQVVFSPEKRVAMADAMQRMGLESPVDELMRSNPDIATREYAMLIIDRNLREQAIVQEARRSFSIPNKTPETNDGYEQ